VATAGAEGGGQVFFEVPPVGQAGQGIGAGEAIQYPHLHGQFRRPAQAPGQRIDTHRDGDEDCPA
jgi:hypothetical protein